MLVRVEACGVCGTDIKKIEKGLLPGPPHLRPRDRGTRGPRSARRPLPRGRPGRAAPSRALPHVFLLRARPLRPVRRLQAQRDDGRVRAVRRRIRRIRQGAGLDRRAGRDPGARRRAPRGGGVRRAGQHLPEGGPPGRHRAGPDGPGGGPGADRPPAHPTLRPGRARTCSARTRCRTAASWPAAWARPPCSTPPGDVAARGPGAHRTAGAPTVCFLAALGQAAVDQAIDAARAGRPYHCVRCHLTWRDGAPGPGRPLRRRKGDLDVLQRVGRRAGPGRAARLLPRGPRAGARQPPLSPRGGRRARSTSASRPAAGVLKVVLAGTPGRNSEVSLLTQKRMKAAVLYGREDVRVETRGRAGPPARRRPAAHPRGAHLRDRRQGLPPRLPREDDRAARRVRARDRRGGGGGGRGRRGARAGHVGGGRQLRALRRVLLLPPRDVEPLRRPALLERRLRGVRPHPRPRRQEEPPAARGRRDLPRGGHGGAAGLRDPRASRRAGSAAASPWR